MFRLLPARLLPPFQHQMPINPFVCSQRELHSSHPLCYIFMKKQIQIDPEIAKNREARKRRKLEKAILKLKEFGKKPKPVEEIQIHPKLRKSLEERHRGPEEVSEEEKQRRVLLLKHYARTRARLARQDIKYINDSVERQKQALALLEHLSPRLYEAAVQPDLTILPLLIEGPPLTPPIASYKSPNGDFINVTKELVQPDMPELTKRFGVGKLIKIPEFKKNQEKQKPANPSPAASSSAKKAEVGKKEAPRVAAA